MVRLIFILYKNEWKPAAARTAGKTQETFFKTDIMRSGDGHFSALALSFIPSLFLRDEKGVESVLVLGVQGLV